MLLEMKGLEIDGYSEDLEGWLPIVLGGTRQTRGMPSFSEVLSGDEAEAIHAYVIAQALREPTLIEAAASWVGRHVCVPASWVVD